MDTLELIGAIAGTLFLLCGLIQLYYYLFVFSRFASYKLQRRESHGVPVSVIICAKNEARNLQQNLPAILEQDYPEYEVIVVNNCSWDSTGKVLEGFEAQHPHLKVVTLVEQEKYPKGKKFGLTLGIKAAKHDVLLFTDADCIPASRHWITRMMSAYGSNTEIVLGYSPYKRAKGFLNRIIRFETIYTALQYFSWSLKGMHYMGVGRNLSYRKPLFFKHKGFASHNHIISGDDDLFVNEAATQNNVSIEASPDSFMLSEPKTTWKDYFAQKTRHLNTGKLYKSKHKAILALLNISHILFYVCMILLLCIGFHLEAILLMFVVRLAAQAFIFWPVCRKLQDKKIFYLYPVFDLYYAFYYILIGPRALFLKQRAWMY